MRIWYFPGCSMVTTARECNRSLREASGLLDLELVELEDWNCCGSTSAHSLDRRLALDLALRNISLVPPGETMMVMCPNCLHNFHQAKSLVKRDPHRIRVLENRWKRPIDPHLEVSHFLEVLGGMERDFVKARIEKDLSGMKVAPYYGCMLAGPPLVKPVRPYAGLMEEVLSTLDARPVLWPHITRCCGTFLAATRPRVSTRAVNQIMGSAMESGAECLVTSCAMCQLNLEIRCTLPKRIPAFHFTEVLALVLGSTSWDKWFSYHIVDPRPLLRRHGVI